MESRRIEYMSIGKLKPAVSNPKDHSISDLAQSIDRFSFVEPVVLDERTGRLVAGHGRVETLVALAKSRGRANVPAGLATDDDGEWLVPVVRGWASRDDQEAQAYLLAANRLTEIGGWNEAALADMLKGLVDGAGLEGIGYDERDLEALLKASGPPQVGKTPQEMLETFQAGEIKQVVLYFDAAQYEQVVATLAELRDAFDVDSNTDVFLRLLEQAGHGVAPPAAAAEG